MGGLLSAHESPPVISFSTDNKPDYRQLILPPNIFSRLTLRIAHRSDALVTPWSRRPTDRLEGVVAEAGEELLPSVFQNFLQTRSCIISFFDKSEMNVRKGVPNMRSSQYMFLETGFYVRTERTVRRRIKDRPNLEQGWERYCSATLLCHSS